MTDSSPASGPDEKTVDELVRERDEALDRVRQLESSVRFRLGDALFEVVRKPLAISSHIRNLRRIMSDGRASLDWSELREALECGQPNDPVRDLPPDERPRTSDLKPLLAMVRDQAADHTLSDDRAAKTVKHRIAELREIAASGIVQPDKSAEAATGAGVAMVLHTGLPYTVNGYVVRSDAIVEALRDLDVEVQPVVRAPIGDMRSPQAGRRRFDPPALEPGDLGHCIRAYADALEDVLQPISPRIIHAASNYVTGLSAGFAARRMGLPFVYEIRGFWESTRASIIPRYKESIAYAAQSRLETQAAHMADHVIVISQPMKDVLVSRGVGAEKISVVRNGANIVERRPEADRRVMRHRFGLPEDAVVVGFVGSITPYEGLDVLVKAFADTCAPQARMLVVGDGGERLALERQAKALGVDDRMVFTGRLPPAEARAAYAAIDLAVYVRPQSEVSALVPPLKPLEAMANAVATIVSDVPAITDLVGRGDHVATVPSGDRRALVETLQTLLGDRERCAAMGRAGASWVADHRTWSLAAADIKAIYEKFG